MVRTGSCLKLPKKAASCVVDARGVRHVRFNPRVACSYIKDLTEAPAEKKAELWWQQEDFDEFLRVRVDIAKGYRAAAKKIGVEIMQVSSLGSHGDEGYRAMIEVMPALIGESRRGLGLGRKRQRAKSRDDYIAACVNEQQRQIDAAKAAGHCHVLDCEELARVTMAISAKDLRYAHFLAMTYFKQDRAVEEAAGAEEQPAGRRRPAAPSVEVPSIVSDSSVQSQEPQDTPIGGSTFCLNDEDLQADETPGKETPSRPRFSTKGFGLSADKLRQVGLGANGHSISRFQQLRRLRVCDEADGRRTTFEDSKAAAESTESDGTGDDGTGDDDDAGDEADDADEDAQYIAQYRNWRMGAPVRAGQPGHSDTKTYGSRKDYRAWRAWQQPAAKTRPPA